METLTETNTGLQVLDQKEEGLKALVKEFTGLKVAGIEDKDGFKKLRDARITLKNERVSITNAAKELRQPAVKFQKLVIEREEQLIAIIEPLETELHAEEKRIEDLKEEQRQQKEMMEAKALQDRLNALAAYNFAADYLYVKLMSDDEFQVYLSNAKSAHEADLLRQAELKAEEDRKRKEEEEALRIKREELERKQVEYDAQRKYDLELAEKAREERERIEEQQRKKEAELRAEREKFEAEKRKHEEEKQAEAARLEAAERARIEEQNRVKREADEKTERERLGKLEAERREALRPDKEKLFAFGKSVYDFMLTNSPDIGDNAVNDCLSDFQVDIDKAVKKLSHKLNCI